MEEGRGTETVHTDVPGGPARPSARRRGVLAPALSRHFWAGLLRSLADTAYRYLAAPDHLCPLCGFAGRFAVYNGRISARCPACGSLERHRLFALLHRRGEIGFRGLRVLHLAPEPVLTRLVEADGPARYVTADLEPGRAELRLDLQETGLPDAEWDAVLCLHVLEHVPDDRRAMAEIRRILAPGGVLLAMVPLVDAWERTFEDPALATPEDRRRHYGQHDHLRLYAAADFVRRLRAAGFEVERRVAEAPACGRHALIPGESLFLARRPAGA